MTTTYHSPLLPTDAASASNLNSRLSDLDSAISDLIAGALAQGQLNLGPAELTSILNGVATVTGSNLQVDTEASAASDDLETLSGGVDGLIIILSAANSARTVVLKHGIGNLQLRGNTDYSLDTVDKAVFLLYYGGYWLDVSGEGFSQAGASVSRSTSQAIATGVATAVSLNNEMWDDNALYDAGSPTRITFVDTARYLVIGNVKFAASAGGTYRKAQLRVDGSTIYAESTRDPISASVETGINLTTVVSATAGQYVELVVQQDSGGNLNVGDANYGTFLQVERMN